MNDMMNPRRRRDRNGQRNEVEGSKNPFFEGDGSSLFTELEEWEGDGVADDSYKDALVFDDDHYEEEIVSEFVGKGFVDKYPNFQEDENNVKKKDLSGKKDLMGEEDNIEDVVVVANDLCSSMIQTTFNVDFEEDINTKSHELMSFGKSILIKVSKSSFKFLIGKKYQEWYLKVAPMVDEFRGRVIIKKGNLMQGIQIWMLRVQGTSEENSRTSFFQVGENDAVMSCFLVNVYIYLICRVS
ncbi:hypothetical protein Tco_0869389 [Tanacetum coccineum]